MNVNGSLYHYSKEIIGRSKIITSIILTNPSTWLMVGIAVVNQIVFSSRGYTHLFLLFEHSYHSIILIDWLFNPTNTPGDESREVSMLKNI